MTTIHSISHPHSLASAIGKARSQHDPQLLKQSQRLVSQAFFGTMLKQMHDSPFKSEIFSGGRGGQAFSTLLDQHLSDHMGASGSGRKLVEAVVKKMEKKIASNPGTKRTPLVHKAPQSPRAGRGGYLKAPARDGRPNVPADYRA
jgi:Rod binding domain-containing protein